MADWVTISSLATAGGTLVLGVATFASVRSANRAARVAERSLLAGLRPLLVPSRLDDPVQKVGFHDNRWFPTRGGCAVAVAEDANIYLTMSLRNVGSGIAVLHAWRFAPGPGTGADGPPPLEEFHRLTRDLYVPAGDMGFWQGAMRDPADPEFAALTAAIHAGERLTIDILYGDHEGGQRIITRFGLAPRGDGDGWLASAGRHWNLDREDPR